MKLFGIATLVLAASALTMADGVPTKVTYVPHDKASKFAGGAAGQIIVDKGVVMLANRRGAGEVEVHEKTNHIFIVMEGEATFVTGGTLVGARQTAPGQTRAPSVDGGATYHLSKGDVITVPAGTPHWFKDVPTQTIAYYAINLEQ
jgi:mannose-6-phosphate isomerase-like protein (cupin superfamily)